MLIALRLWIQTPYALLARGTNLYKVYHATYGIYFKLHEKWTSLRAAQFYQQQWPATHNQPGNSHTHTDYECKLQAMHGNIHTYCNAIISPVQLWPFPAYPILHLHSNAPCEFAHSALISQEWAPVVHSSCSIGDLHRQYDMKSCWNGYVSMLSINNLFERKQKVWRSWRHAMVGF